jgi:hypothetical protein
MCREWGQHGWSRPNEVTKSPPHPPLQAVPSFEAFGRFLENANPFAFWAHAMQVAWLPWRAAAQAVLPPGLTLPQVEATRSSDGNRQTK